MAITSARMQMRRGLEADFDPNKMQPGEWAVSLDKKYVRMCFSVGVCVRMATYEAFEADMAEIQSIMAEARTIQEAVARIQTEINNTAIVVEDYAILSKSYAVGGTGTRIGEDTDNSKYYSELAKTESDKATTEADRAKTEADRAYSIVNIGIATTEKAGIVKPDGTTITVDADGTIHSVGGGGTAGTTDYEDLANKPLINGVKLSGNKTTSDLGITAESVGADTAGSASTALSDAKSYTDTKIADLVGGAPSTLDTLKEISDALAASEEAVEAINQAIGNKLEKNGDSKDNTVTFTQASTRENIASTEKHSTLFGKIAKWFADLKAVAFSGSYNDLSNKPTIPTVNDATLTIQKNGNTVQTFTANASSNKTANITVPTKTSELENDSGFLSSATALDTYEEIMANTQSGKFAGANGVKEGFSEINNSLKWWIEKGYLPDPNNPNIALIPAMTSNTTPSGVASASYEATYNSEVYYAYHAFADDNLWWHSGTSVKPMWISYKFDTPKVVKKFTLENVSDDSSGYVNSFKLQASNDNSTWVDLGTYTNSNVKGAESTFNVSNESSYLYYRIYVVSIHDSINYARIKRIQMYGA